MKKLIEIYIDQLTIDKIDNFAKKNDINLNNKELAFLLNTIKNNYNDILLNQEKYEDLIKENIKEKEALKIIDIFNYYKNRYKNYLL